MIQDKKLLVRFEKYYNILLWRLYGSYGFAKKFVLSNKDKFIIKISSNRTDNKDMRLYFYNGKKLFYTLSENPPVQENGKYRVEVGFYDKESENITKIEEFFIG